MSTGHDTGGWITHFWLSNLRQNIPVFDLSRSSICLSKTTEINRTLPLTYVKPQEACQVLHCLPLAPQAPGTRLLAASSIMCHLHDLLTNFSQPPLSTLLLGWRPLTMCPTSVSEYSHIISPNFSNSLMALLRRSFTCLEITVAKRPRQ